MSSLSPEIFRGMVKADTEREGKMFEAVKYWFSNARYTMSSDGWVQGDVVTDTDNLFHGMGVDEALGAVPDILKLWPISSYLAFCTNANVDSINAAFGMNNEENVAWLGRALAMFAWFKGEDKTVHTFENLMKCHTLEEIKWNDAAFAELKASPILSAFVKGNTYAYEKITNKQEISFQGRTINDFIVTSYTTATLTNGDLYLARTGIATGTIVEKTSSVKKGTHDAVFVLLLSGSQSGNTSITFGVEDGALSGMGAASRSVQSASLLGAPEDLKLKIVSSGTSSGANTNITLNRYWLGNTL